MERLTKRDFSRITYNERRSIMCSSYCDNCSQGAGNCKTVKNMIKKLATYEDLEEQGLLVRLPCKVGDTVYRVNAGAKQPIIPMTVSGLVIFHLLQLLLGFFAGEKYYSSNIF